MDRWSICTAWERGFTPTRPTNDGDAVLDVRGHPNILLDFTTKLTELGFASAGENLSGHQHRWQRGSASIDILIPADLEERARARKGVTGGTTLETRAAQQALDRSEQVDIDLDATIGAVPRPNLLGALVAKAAAYSEPLDVGRQRHLTDFVVLAAMISRRDRIAEQLTKRDREHLSPLLADLPNKRSDWVGIEGAERGVELLTGISGEPAEPKHNPLLREGS